MIFVIVLMAILLSASLIKEQRRRMEDATDKGADRRTADKHGHAVRAMSKEQSVLDFP